MFEFPDLCVTFLSLSSRYFHPFDLDLIINYVISTSPTLLSLRTTDTGKCFCQLWREMLYKFVKFFILIIRFHIFSRTSTQFSFPWSITDNTYYIYKISKEREVETKKTSFFTLDPVSSVVFSFHKSSRPIGENRGMHGWPFDTQYNNRLHTPIIPLPETVINIQHSNYCSCYKHSNPST